jgi:pimeloyl-CoA synthetase
MFQWLLKVRLMGGRKKARVRSGSSDAANVAESGGYQQSCDVTRRRRSALALTSSGLHDSVIAEVCPRTEPT